MHISFEVPFVKGKERARTLKSGRSYTPKQTVDCEKAIREAYFKAGGKEITGPVGIRINASYPIPKSLSKKKQQELIGAYAEKKPDVDNVLKLVMDGLQQNKANPEQYAYKDDSQICEVSMIKKMGEAGMRVEVFSLDQE